MDNAIEIVDDEVIMALEVFEDMVAEKLAGDLNSGRVVL